MTRYAEGTKVPVDRSVAEIRSHLKRWKGEGFFYQEDPDTGHVKIGFRMDSLFYRLNLPMPKRSAFRQETQYDAEVRRRWRVLAAFTKSLLFGIEEGIVTAQEALLPFVILKDGQTFAEMLKNGTLNSMLALPAGQATDASTREV